MIKSMMQSGRVTVNGKKVTSLENTNNVRKDQNNKKMIEAKIKDAYAEKPPRQSLMSKNN